MSIIRRKKDHIKLVNQSQTDISTRDDRFYYEPLINSHINNIQYNFLGQSVGAPIFISSMTGGSRTSKKINNRLAMLAKRYQLPMGLGSLRPYLESYEKASFSIRKEAGSDVLLFGNIGISQLEELVLHKRTDEIYSVLNYLELNGLIIHINPLQEWVQPGGDRLTQPAIQTLNTFLSDKKTTVIVKEVGCGFGPNSLEKLLTLPLDVIDLAGYGGTNFTKMELLRSPKKLQIDPLINIGESNLDMINSLNNYTSLLNDKEFIISGGIRSYLDGYYFMQKLHAPSIYGYAYPLLQQALRSEKHLFTYMEREISGLQFTHQFLTVK